MNAHSGAALAIAFGPLAEGHGPSFTWYMNVVPVGGPFIQRGSQEVSCPHHARLAVTISHCQRRL